MRRGLIAGAALLLVLGLAGLVLAALDRSSQEVFAGVSVWGEPAGGLAAEELEARLAARSRRALGNPLRLLGDGEQVSLVLVPREAGLQLDKEGSAAAALAVGRSASWWQNLLERGRAWRSGRSLPPQLVVEQATWIAKLDELSLTVERLPLDAQLRLTEEGPKVVAAQEGIALDRDELRRRVLSAVAAGEEVVALPLQAVLPAVTTEQARNALAAAKQAFAAPVSLTYREFTLELLPAALAELAVLAPEAAASGRPLSFASEEARARLEVLLAPLERKPRDAQIVVAPDAKSFTVQPSEEGTAVEWQSLLSGLARVVTETPPRRLPIPTVVAYPKITTRDARELGERREIASFTTYFNPGNAARANNIRQVTKLLDGNLVRPGETFSFNETVGPRTKAAGFDEAPVIVGGLLTPGIGGGICQVSTTLFSAAFLAGLPVVERKAHSLFLERYPIGRDATVSYGSTDLRFRNDSQGVLLINATAGGDYVRVSLAAPQWDRKVEYETSPFTDVKAPASTASRPRRLRDPALARGEVAPLEPGVDGRTVQVHRRVLRGDGSLLFEDRFESVYQPKDFVVRVGG